MFDEHMFEEEDDMRITMIDSPAARRRRIVLLSAIAAIALAILLFLMALRRSGERTGRLAERLEIMEKTNDVQRRMLEAAARRPRSRDDLAERLRDGRF